MNSQYAHGLGGMNADSPIHPKNLLKRPPLIIHGALKEVPNSPSKASQATSNDASKVLPCPIFGGDLKHYGHITRLLKCDLDNIKVAIAEARERFPENVTIDADACELLLKAYEATTEIMDTANMKTNSKLIKNVWYSPNILGRKELPMVVFLIDGTKISINRKGMSAWMEIKKEEKISAKKI
jgi:hypothetical protein